MVAVLGIDYGSNMIKAAGTDDPDESAEGHPAGSDDPFFPAAVQLTSDGRRDSAGWDAFMVGPERPAAGDRFSRPGGRS